jgi:hypothetical protein
MKKYLMNDEWHIQMMDEISSTWIKMLKNLINKKW